MGIAPWSSLEPEHPKSSRAPVPLSLLPPMAAGLSKCGQTLPGAAAKLLQLFPPLCPSAQEIRLLLPCFPKGFGIAKRATLLTGSCYCLLAVSMVWH